MLSGLSQLDSDIVWLHLVKQTNGMEPVQQAAGAVGSGLRPWHEIAPQTAWFERGQGGNQRLMAALLQEVEAAAPAWHTRLSRETMVL